MKWQNNTITDFIGGIAFMAMIIFIAMGVFTRNPMYFDYLFWTVIGMLLIFFIKGKKE